MSVLVTITEPIARTMILKPPLTDKELVELCGRSDFQIERRRDGTIVMNPPTGPDTGSANSAITGQLYAWAKANKMKGRVFDSSTGFFLPDGSMRSPDASYATERQMPELTKWRLAGGIPHFCPAFVIELKSTSDSLSEAQQKMQDWITNGADLGWLIVPKTHQVLVYHHYAREALVLTALEVSGSGPVEGFTLDLQPVWECYE